MARTVTAGQAAGEIAGHGRPENLRDAEVLPKATLPDLGVDDHCSRCEQCSGHAARPSASGTVTISPRRSRQGRRPGRSPDAAGTGASPEMRALLPPLARARHQPSASRRGSPAGPGEGTLGEGLALDPRRSDGRVARRRRLAAGSNAVAVGADERGQRIGRSAPRNAHLTHDSRGW